LKKSCFVSKIPYGVAEKPENSENNRFRILLTDFLFVFLSLLLKSFLRFLVTFFLSFLDFEYAT